MAAPEEGTRKWWMFAIIEAGILAFGIAVLAWGKMTDTIGVAIIGGMTLDGVGYGGANLIAKNIANGSAVKKKAKK